MLKQGVQLEVKKGENLYQLNFPNNASLGEIFDILFQMRSFVVDKINESQKLDQPKEADKPKEG